MAKRLKNIVRSIFSGNAIIPWMLIVAVIPMIIVSYFAYNMAEAILRRAINVSLMTTIQKKIEVIDTYIRERKLDLYQIGELPTLLDAIHEAQTPSGQLETISPEKIRAFTEYLNYLGEKIGIYNVYLINLSGKILYTLKQDATLGFTLQANSRSYVDLYRAFENAKILREPTFTETKDAAAEIYLSTPVNEENGELKAILVMRLKPEKIEEVINRLLGYGKSEETLLATLINNKPVVIMHTTQVGDDTNLMVQEDSDIQTYLSRAIRGETSMPVEFDENGKGVMAVYRYVPQLNMGMLLKYDRAEVFERIHWLGINMIIFIAISLFFVIALVFWISRALWQANRRNEQLLANIFPPFVIEELKEKKQFVAKNVENVAIIFIDIADFTTYASHKPPETVVQFLDKIFTIFDQICDQYDIMKIKTIGDAYMAAAGLSGDRENQVQRAVDLGIQVILTMKHFNLNHNTNFAVRIGIDLGTITEGIIGKTKFSFDIWGNAVNRASRMQSTGEKNKIQITEEAYEALTNKENYIFTPRSHLVVKGLGELNTYFVEEKDRGLYHQDADFFDKI